MSPRRLLIVAIVGSLALAGLPCFAQQKLPVAELKKLLSLEASEGAEESSETLSELKKGYSADVIRVAEKSAVLRGEEARGEAAVELIFDEVRTLIRESGSTETASQEAIIIPNAILRPALHTCGGLIDEPVPPTWHEELNQRQAALKGAMASVGLISVSGIPNSGPKGTGFVVAPGLVMTNRHVAEEFAAADGNGGFRFKKHPATGQAARVIIDFTVDRCSLAASPSRVEEVIHIEADPGPDVALLRVAGPMPPKLELQTSAPSDGLKGRLIYVVGYPFSDSRNPFDIQSQVFGFDFGVKRLAPGTLMEGSGTPLAAGEEALLLHDCATLGGNSGSAVIDLASNSVLGIHFAGRFSEQNFGWPMWRVLEIEKIAEALEE